MSTDPKRLLDPESDASDALRDALAVAREDMPDETQLDALATRLGPWLDPGPGGGSGGADAGGGGGAAAGAAGATAVKAVVGTLIIAAVGSGALWMRAAHSGSEPTVRHPSAALDGLAPEARQQRPPSAATGTTVVARSHPHPAPSPAMGPATPSAAIPHQAPVVPAVGASADRTRSASGQTPVAPSATGALPGVPAAAGASTPMPSAASAGNARDANGASAELTLLDRAQDALARSPAQCLRLTAEHARRFPDGVLTQEREVLAIEALLRLGHRAEASTRAARFRSRFPGSAQLPHIDALLAR